MSKKHHVTIRVNGDEYEYLCEPQQTLLDALRDELMLTGTKEGCATGDCGACTVMLDGVMTCSCLVLAVEAEGAKIDTIEGMAKGDTLHPLQQAFQEHHALQCGFCTPGLLMTAYALLQETPHPSRDEVREAIAGNICRCTGYAPIVQAIVQASSALQTPEG